MGVTHVHQCLTRVVTDHDGGIEIAQLQNITERIRQMLPQVSARECEYIARTLLNFAVSAMTDADVVSSLR
jgi:hypothetical protein